MCLYLLSSGNVWVIKGIKCRDNVERTTEDAAISPELYYSRANPGKVETVKGPVHPDVKMADYL